MTRRVKPCIRVGASPSESGVAARACDEVRPYAVVRHRTTALRRGLRAAAKPAETAAATQFICHLLLLPSSGVETRPRGLPWCIMRPESFAEALRRDDFSCVRPLGRVVPVRERESVQVFVMGT